MCGHNFLQLVQRPLLHSGKGLAAFHPEFLRVLPKIKVLHRVPGFDLPGVASFPDPHADFLEFIAGS
ncbi:hypothetical protein D3C75_1004400 [compost metagenome]